MKAHVRCLIALSSMVLCPDAALPGSAGASPAKGLTAFTSDQELSKYLARLKPRSGMGDAVAAAGDIDQIAVTGSRVSESITNAQTAGVDEGSIVKLHGNHLVVLRRGRLFTIDIAGQSPRPVAWINAYGPGIDPDSTWYDEMLIHEDRILVIGYSYNRGGTEIALFDIDSTGSMRYDATYNLSSDDYYSSRNYSSRLADGKLIFYTPIGIRNLDSLPTLHRWPSFVPPKGQEKAGGTRTIPATRIYRPARDLAPDAEAALHTITTCDLNAPKFSCQATGVLGNSGEVFYVSSSAVYVWTGQPRWLRSSKETSILYRLPLDGTLPSAMQTFGTPIDQFSFLEQEGYINVLTGSKSSGAWMWNAEQDPGEIALLRAPLSEFDAGKASPKVAQYFRLPKPKQDGAFQNRFVGERLLYGIGSGWYDSATTTATLNVVDARTRSVTPVPLAHGVDRIESLGTNAIVIGADGRGTLHFSGIDLSSKPRPHRHFALPNAGQAELRSHGFFYSPTSLGGAIGLPIRASGEKGWRHLHEDAAGVLFLRIRKEDFQEAGLLSGEAESTDDDDDGCQASCVDWYGNSRPIFIRGRVFGLLGYELVEGRVQGNRIVEGQRVDFTPYVEGSH